MGPGRSNAKGIIGHKDIKVVILAVLIRDGEVLSYAGIAPRVREVCQDTRDGPTAVIMNKPAHNRKLVTAWAGAPDNKAEVNDHTLDAGSDNVIFSPNTT
jgi:hypothetical protein